MRLPEPLVHSVTAVETACEYFSLTGPSVTDDGLTQLSADVDEVVTVGETVGDGETEGLTVPAGVTVPVGEGVEVVLFGTMVKTNSALRCVTASTAWMTCCPIVQDGLTVTVTLKVPSPLAERLLPDNVWVNTCEAAALKLCNALAFNVRAVRIPGGYVST